VIEFGPEAFATAFAAGFLSFTAPCVLPLVPGYLSYVSGVAVDELGAQPQRVTVTTAWFVASPQCSSPSEPGPPGSAVLLAIYALVLGVPFLAFGLAFTRAIAVVGLLHRHWRIVYVRLRRSPRPLRRTPGDRANGGDVPSRQVQRREALRPRRSLRRAGPSQHSARRGSPIAGLASPELGSGKR
jgi:hypothetical protein